MYSQSIKKSSFNITSLLIFSYALYAIKCVWLAFANDYMPLYALAMQLPLALSFGLGAVCVLYRQGHVFRNRWLVLLPFIYFFYSILHSYGTVEYAQILFTFAVCFLFVLFSEDTRARIFDVFYWVIQVCNIFSVLFYVCYLLHINLGFQELPYYSLLQPNARYVKWLIFAIFKSGFQLRLCSIFNEPGALGTVCSLLFAARYSYSKRWERLLLLVTILCSFSLAGVIIVAGFYSFVLLRKNPFLLLVLAGITVGAGAFILSRGEGQLAYLVLRIISGEDNRTKPAFDIFYEQFIKGSHFWLGMGKGFPVADGVSSIKTYVVQYGILGVGFWLFMWAAASIKEGGRKALLFVLFFFISLYQRPALIESIYGFVLLFGGIDCLSKYSK